ncbi:fucosyltransferase 1 [Actinidia rufa]|uniref:Fucosyltransferase n=1 Tax=Actinidia rufa TaxID=165716 RepID=A0A7J0FND2_9ERIC|nr:fucosyltransferase 1 [Actinidia rufa]
MPKDKFLGGLLPSSFSELSCLSRYQSVIYRKPSPHKPSSYLISKIRSYEALHKRCGPYTEPYNRTLNQLKPGRVIGNNGCKYVVHLWMSHSGLGNRLLSLASSFLYAILTKRVLLIDQGHNMNSLLCEPFPETTWVLPSDFPIKNQFKSFDKKSPNCYGTMLKNKTINTSMDKSLPSFLYLNLIYDYDEYDKHFFCDKDQGFVKKVPWLILRSDQYFIPSLFLIPSFEKQLTKLFPKKQELFFTTWVGTFSTPRIEKICCPKLYPIPKILFLIHQKNPKTKAVLITSLNSWYFEEIRNTYWQNPTSTGEVISVYQPSHEEFQQIGNPTHDIKALAEIYLLSLMDVLVTSPWSTFGYVAQGLGALKPWVLNNPHKEMSFDSPCHRARSMEPCFHFPPFYDCEAKTESDTGARVPYVGHCEDTSWGLKLFDDH